MSLRNDTDAERQTPTPHELAVLDTAAAAASTPGLDPAVGVAIDEAAADEQMRTDYADTPPSANHGNNFAGPPVIVKELNVSDLETAKRAPAEWVPADAPGEGGEIVGAAPPILVEQQAAHNEGESPVQHAHHMRVLESKVEDRRKIHAELLAYKQDALRYKSCHIQHPSDRAERSGHVRALREQNAGHALAMHAWTNTSTDAREQSSAELDRLRTMHDNLVDEVHRLLRPAGETGSMMEATSSSSVELSLMHQAVREDLAAQETAMLHACEIDASAAELARLTGLNADLLVCVASLRENNTTLVRVVAEHELAEQEMARLHAYETEVSTSKAHHLRRFNSYLIKLVMSLRTVTDGR